MDELSGLNIGGHASSFLRRVGRQLPTLRCALFLRESGRISRKIADVAKASVDIGEILPDHFRGAIRKASVVQRRRTLALQQQGILFSGGGLVARAFKTVRHNARLLLLEQVSQCRWD